MIRDLIRGHLLRQDGEKMIHYSANYCPNCMAAQFYDDEKAMWCCQLDASRSLFKKPKPRWIWWPVREVTFESNIDYFLATATWPGRIDCSKLNQ